MVVGFKRVSCVCLHDDFISGMLTVPGPDGKPVQISQTALQNAQNAMFNGGKKCTMHFQPKHCFGFFKSYKHICYLVNPFGQLVVKDYLEGHFVIGLKSHLSRPQEFTFFKHLFLLYNSTFLLHIPYFIQGLILIMTIVSCLQAYCFTHDKLLDH